MALILPRSYHKIGAVERNRISWIEPAQAERQDIRPLRIGILNIMPLGKQYEFNCCIPLGCLFCRSNRLDPTHLPRLQKLGPEHSGSVRSWEDALAQGPDGLIITGAPVEHLPEQVNYWKELVELIEEARQLCQHAGAVLGRLCPCLSGWCGQGSARTEAVRHLSNAKLIPGHPLMGTQDDRFLCPQSRHAGLPDAAMESAQRQGRLRLLAYGEDVGYTIFETPDQRQLMHPVTRNTTWGESW